MVSGARDLGLVFARLALTSLAAAHPCVVALAVAFQTMRLLTVAAFL